MFRSNDVPLWTARVATLAMAWAWSIISFAAGINAVVKSNQDKAKIKDFAPRGTQVDINVNDVFRTGAIISAVSIVIFVLTSLYLILLFFRPTSFTRSRIVTAQGSLLAFFAVWLFATLVAYTHFFRTHSAIVNASINGLPLPDTLIRGVEKELGVTPVYKNIAYLRLVAILPWFNLLFTISAAVVLFMAASRAERVQAARPTEGPANDIDRTSETMDEKI
ncbi:hypothetical protein P691DRAFT_679154 [Macrolepiota fuliginosa MF-IS2]|uniref:Uncharacterized protein n=1 Tax=Macrolepiota fuliginosa MF-IS2 TaxID=1400762 RepID=A0A9P5X2K7_9AGAR|nr:hypothetical protein P691DRAFT_679154 [Macrolepiota fuliginosa MF-IS2]